ncbi:IclR family transcriptional regulator [Paenibacillus durus]|nr:IclR family transcriptional regulator [Paenibacillus durus]
MMKQYESATLKKGLSILEALQQSEPMKLTDIMRLLGLNKSTTFRLLYTLEITGYVKKEEHLYSLTEKVGGGTAASANPRLDWIAVPPLHQLSQEVGETLYIGILNGINVVTTQVVEGTHSMRIHSKVGDYAYVHLSAFGKVILAHLDEGKRETVLNNITLQKNTKNTFADLHLLREHLKVIRQQGYAIDDEETEIGLRCIAAPIFHKGEAIAAVALSGPSARLTKKKDRALSKKLLACSAQISSLLDK